MITLNYLVTGTGRSGTVYLAKLLSSVGVSCGHECIFNFEGINAALDRLKKREILCLSWVGSQDGMGWFDSRNLQADASYMAAPYLAHDCLKNTTIIHVVRNPLLVVSSFLLDVEHFQNNPKVEVWDKFIEFHLPEIRTLKTPIERACYYYAQWNQMVEPYSNVLHRIEDGAESLFTKFGIEPKIYFDDRSANSFGKRDRNITLNEIPEGQIKDDFLLMFQKYGYPVEDVPYMPPPKLLV